MIELIVLLTVFTYGTNFVLYLILKNKKSMPIVEKASIVLGINMSVLLLDGIFCFRWQIHHVIRMGIISAYF